MVTIPQDHALDSTLALIREGYCFIPNRMKRYKTTIFETRLLLEKVICLHGIEATTLFYDATLFQRVNALPDRVKKTLTGSDGVQTLDGNAHHHRKEMFMACMTPESRIMFQQLFHKNLSLEKLKWHKEPVISLFKQSQTLLCTSACEWVGIPLVKEKRVEWAETMGAMIDGFGGIGLRYLRGKSARKKAERDMQLIVRNVRNKSLIPLSNSVLSLVVWHRNEQGELLDEHTVAVELLNLIRPITAIATYITFTALALHCYPEVLDNIKTVDEALSYDKWFIQEVRRFYPFTPFIGARVKEDFAWQGYFFPKDRLVILDIYGLLHDPVLWKDPEKFYPERFEQSSLLATPYLFIPQGGGDYMMGHRCAGELMVIDTLKTVLHFLVHECDYTVPKQNLNYPLSRIPTLPASGFLMQVKS